VATIQARAGLVILVIAQDYNGTTAEIHGKRINTRSAQSEPSHDDAMRFKEPDHITYRSNGQLPFGSQVRSNTLNIFSTRRFRKPDSRQITRRKLYMSF